MYYFLEFLKSSYGYDAQKTIINPKTIIDPLIEENNQKLLQKIQEINQPREEILKKYKEKIHELSKEDISKLFNKPGQVVNIRIPNHLSYKGLTGYEVCGIAKEIYTKAYGNHVTFECENTSGYDNINARLRR